MRVRLLGTGSADGWPNPFCDCRSCAAERAAGRARTSTSAIIDDSILVDFGPSTADALRRTGVSLSAQRHLLVTHGHADHLAPAFLLWRTWIADLPTLHVWGPAAALESCAHWMSPQAQAELHPIAPGADLALDGGYQVRALAAAHGTGNGDTHADEALIYDITGPDGDRLLYATDTAPLSAPTLDALRDRAFDLVLIEETFGTVTDHGTGHHDLPALRRTLTDLHTRGATTEGTQVVAIHLSHHNPPTDELAALLKPMGVAVVDDGTVIDTRATNEHQSSTRPSRHLVIGGARSGKSHYAEQLAGGRSDVHYVATGGHRPDDPEWVDRVARHQARRPNQWTTIETTDLANVLRTAPADSCVVIDCLTLWLTAVLDQADAWTDDPGARARAERAARLALDATVQALADCAAEVVLVTNEVGMDLVPVSSSGRLFRDLLGEVNARIADACTRVTLVVAGRPIDLSGRSTSPEAHHGI